MTQLDTIYEQLTQVFREVFRDDTLIATPALRAEEVPGWDSFAHMRLMLTLERTFEVEFDDSELEQLESVGSLATLIQSKRP